jgi:hypothetical protein
MKIKGILKQKNLTELVGNMEKVIVKKDIPGILKAGDILALEGDSFFLSGNESDDFFTDSWYVNIDKVTVYDNIPSFFEFIVDESEISVKEKTFTDEEVIEMLTSKEVARSPKEIKERYEFYKDRLGYPFFNGNEGKIVYQNLIWFIDWLYGERDLLK